MNVDTVLAICILVACVAFHVVVEIKEARNRERVSR